MRWVDRRIGRTNSLLLGAIPILLLIQILTQGQTAQDLAEAIALANRTEAEATALRYPSCGTGSRLWTGIRRC